MESGMDSSLAAVVSFDCEVCQGLVVVNAESLPARGSIECLHPNCGAHHRWQGSHGEDMFYLEATTFECLACGDGTALENRKLDIGYEFACDGCGERHQLLERRWGYAQSSDVVADDPLDAEGHRGDGPKSKTGANGG